VRGRRNLTSFAARSSSHDGEEEEFSFEWKGELMKALRVFLLAGIAGMLFLVAGSNASAAQVSVTIGAAPVCPYGYFNYSPYSCAPYGYYGPEWFPGGIFIGAGPWFHGRDHFRGHVDDHFDPHHGYHGALPRHGDENRHGMHPEHNSHFNGHSSHEEHSPHGHS
jgi:hypothetical protein